MKIKNYSILTHFPFVLPCTHNNKSFLGIQNISRYFTFLFYYLVIVTFSIDIKIKNLNYK